MDSEPSECCLPSRILAKILQSSHPPDIVACPGSRCRPSPLVAADRPYGPMIRTKSPTDALPAAMSGRHGLEGRGAAIPDAVAPSPAAERPLAGHLIAAAAGLLAGAAVVSLIADRWGVAPPVWVDPSLAAVVAVLVEAALVSRRRRPAPPGGDASEGPHLAEMRGLRGITAASPGMLFRAILPEDGTRESSSTAMRPARSRGGRPSRPRDNRKPGGISSHRRTALGSRRRRGRLRGTSPRWTSSTGS
jgi:hypothetical protein